jgi:hypothetical protein
MGQVCFELLDLLLEKVLELATVYELDLMD